jgi:hypothetical protein
MAQQRILRFPEGFLANAITEEMVERYVPEATERMFSEYDQVS